MDFSVIFKQLETGKLLTIEQYSIFYDTIDHSNYSNHICYSFNSALFPDVVNCMQTDNLELKKLVYLYLMNYAKSQPDMAIMAVNTFVKVRGRVALNNHCKQIAV